FKDTIMLRILGKRGMMYRRTVFQLDCDSVRIYYENLVVSINNKEPSGNNKIT
uniref:Uncharacterized protein n=1 Tax=Amphimedon queenslandica TaxID=400682 RepID=A0A1X7VCF5_AMPQE